MVHDCRVPRHSVIELQKRTYYHVGVIFALSLIHGGPAPQFLSAAIADYIVYGAISVKATDVIDSDEEVQSADDESAVVDLTESSSTNETASCNRASSKFESAVQSCFCLI